jgi:hypothetical protein
MSRTSDLNWKPSGPGVVKTTQRVTERMDGATLDLHGKTIDVDYYLPTYECEMSESEMGDMD